MTFKSSINIKDAIRGLDNIRDDVVKSINRETTKTAHKIEGYAIKQINQNNPTGKTYIKENGVKHVASAPGFFPKTDTGNLVSSIKATYSKTDRNGLELWRVGSLLDYAEWLEYGTTQIAARPWLRPSAAKFEKDHVKRLNEQIQRAINANS